MHTTNSHRRLGINRAVAFVLSAATLLLSFSVTSWALPDLQNYCVKPPYVKKDVKPNIIILMDNDEINGSTAYPISHSSGYSSGYTYAGYSDYKFYRSLSGTAPGADDTAEYHGLFVPDAWYTSTGTRFDPVPMQTITNATGGVFYGNLLNWVATSRYDHMMKVLVGGKSASRQTNAKTLVGYNTGTWEGKAFFYQGTDGNYHVCEFLVNLGDRGDLTIQESVVAKSAFGYTCGLIADPVVGPASEDWVSYTPSLAMNDTPGDAIEGEEVLYTYNALSLGRSPWPARERMAAQGPSGWDQTAAAGDADYLPVAPVLSGRTFALAETALSALATHAYAAPPPPKVKCTAIEVIKPASEPVAITEAIMGQPYSGYTFEASGGSDVTVFGWTAEASDPLPAGMSINLNTGLVSGTPTVSGTFSVIIKVSDQTASPTDNCSVPTVNDYIGTAYRTVSLTVSKVAITSHTTGDVLPSSQQSSVYPGLVFTAAGGAGTYTWSATGLPTGMWVDAATGLLSGIPTDFGTFGVTVTASDGFSSDSVTVSLEITQASPPIIMNQLSGSYISDGFLNAPYSYLAFASSGVPPYTWSASNLHTGLSINPATGLISGTPTVSGSRSVTVTVTDSLGSTDSESWSLWIFSTSNSALSVQRPITSLPDGTQNEPYEGYQPVSYYGTGAYTWTVTGLPAGMTYNSSYGYVSGTPTATGTFNVTFTVKSGAETATRTVTLTISPPAIQITQPSYPNEYITSGYLNGSYDGYTPTAIYGTTPYTWNIMNLPAGLTFSSATGAITGTPTVFGNFEVTFKATDSSVPAQFDTAIANIVVAETIPTDSADFAVKVCLANPEDPYNDNCDGGTYNKVGLLEDYYSEARWGLTDFASQSGAPSVDCITDNQTAESFKTSVENAVPSKVRTQLVQGLYDTLMEGYFSDDANCDPYPTDDACRDNYVLMITGGDSIDNPPTEIATIANSPAAVNSAYVFPDGASSLQITAFPGMPGECTTPPASALNDPYYNLTLNSCYAYYAKPHFKGDVYDDEVKVQTFVVGLLPVPLANTVLSDTAEAGGGNYYQVKDPTLLYEQLKAALDSMISRAASGTAASVLASGEGSGANLIQAIYYPRRKFYDSVEDLEYDIYWIGRLATYWYYVDPYFSYSSMREETDGNTTLHLKNDYVVNMFFDTNLQKVRGIRASDDDGNGSPDTLIDTLDFEQIGSLWEAGLQLWARNVDDPADPYYDPRTIYVNLYDTSSMSVFNTTLATTNADLRTYLGGLTATEAEYLVRWTHGEFMSLIDPGMRDRRVRLDLDGDGLTNSTAAYVSQINNTIDETVKRDWKLADVVNSTPKLLSIYKLNNYDGIYGANTQLGSTYYDFYNSTAYQERGMVFAGGNDGMLHAFTLGQLCVNKDACGLGEYDAAKITFTNGTTIGKEEWAFLPKNALPYLSYYADTGYTDCHIFSVDLTPLLIDVAVAKPSGCAAANYWDCALDEESWRTILIGGMRTGGACKDFTASCAVDTIGDPTAEDPVDVVYPDGTVDSYDCTKTPVAGVGFSSYFALDVTDPKDPIFLWEFSGSPNGSLGTATTAPTIVRVESKTGDTNGDGEFNALDQSDDDNNGRWYVLVGSGPTGPILSMDSAFDQFMGTSDQNMKVFVLDAYTGQLLTSLDPGIPKSYASSMLFTTNDTDVDAQDDVVYIGYVSTSGSGTSTRWDNGGVLRLLTWEDLDPTNWQISKVAENVGPVTASVQKLQAIDLEDNSKSELWLYFGTGRYYWKADTARDDNSNVRQLFGVKEQCYTPMTGGDITNVPFSWGCSVANVVDDYRNDLDDMTVYNAPVYAADSRGWFIDMDPAGEYTYYDNILAEDKTFNYGAERVITDPLASTLGVVYFTSYKPYDEKCELGGKSFIWAVLYDTGGSATHLLKGTALIQVSTGAIEQIDLRSQFSDPEPRRSSAIEGVPPTAQGFSIMTMPKPRERVLHIKDL